MTQRTEIEFELNETIAYSRKDERAVFFCPQCQTAAEMAVPHLASIITEISEREIFRRIEASRAHFIEIDRVMVCLKSLTSYQSIVEEMLEDEMPGI